MEEVVSRFKKIRSLRSVTFNIESKETNLLAYLDDRRYSDKDKLKKICVLKESGNEELNSNEEFMEQYEKVFIDPYGDSIYEIKAFPSDCGMTLTEEDLDDITLPNVKALNVTDPKNSMEAIRTIWRDEVRKKLKEQLPDVPGPRIHAVANKLQVLVYDGEVAKASTKDEIVKAYDDSLAAAIEKGKEMVKAYD